MQIPRRYDVFPSKVDTDPIQRLHPTFPLHDFITYVPYLHSEKLKMYYYHVGYGRMLSDNMQRTLSSALRPSTEWTQKFDWNHANIRLIIDWEANNPDRRCDTRLSFCSGNTYLVKKFFTFGKREVDREEVHVLQTTQAPLLFYLPKSQRRAIVDSQPERAFHHQHENFYDRYVLQPNSVYTIPGGTSYLLMTLVKSLFSLHRVTPEVAHRLESLWDCGDPTSHTDYEGWRRQSVTDPYVEPPPSVMPLDYFVVPVVKRPPDPCPVAKRHKARPPKVSKQPVFKQPVLTEPPPVFKKPPPVFKEPPPIFKEPPPVFKEPPPVLTEPTHVLAEPPPVFKEPPHVLTEPPPVFKEPPPVLTEPPVRLPVESPVQSPESIKPSVATNYVDDFFNAMPDFTDNGKPRGATHYYRRTPVECPPMYQPPMEPCPTFDAILRMESYPMFDDGFQTNLFQTSVDPVQPFDASFQPAMDPVNSVRPFDAILRMESYPMFDDSFQTSVNSVQQFDASFEPAMDPVNSPFDASFQPAMDPVNSPFDASVPPAVVGPSNVNLFQPTESFRPFNESFRPAVLEPTSMNSPFDESVQTNFGDLLDFESIFSGLSESTLQELDGDIEHYLLQIPV